MEQYIVKGMSCAACSARVEKAVSQVPGVESCTVSLLTNSMGVEGTAPPDVIIHAVEQAGYKAKLKKNKEKPTGATGVSEEEEQPEDKETPLLKKRLIWSVLFLLVLMYFSMGYTMWGWSLPEILTRNPVAIGLIQLLLTTMIMVINQRFFISGFKSLLHGAPNMDTLVALGAGAAYVYSTYALFAMSDAQAQNHMEHAAHYLHQFYFESAGMILTLITVGKMLEARSKGKTTDAIKGLMKLAPKTAVVERQGVETTVSIEEVVKGDVFLVKPGESIPVDGKILEGSSAVNESSLTGESVPVDKGPGDTVSAATINQSGFLRCEATRVGEDTTLSQIIQMVSDAAATKAPIAKIADVVSGVFVPIVIAIAVLTTLVWVFLQGDFGYALARGISVLVISCPCALGLATPVAIMVGNGVGARNGILFKTAVSLEETGKAKLVVLDKTGTITKGEPEVTDIVVAADFTGDDAQARNRQLEQLLTKAAALEHKSEHPLARAINEYAEGHKAEYGITDLILDDFEALPGNGVEGKYESTTLFGGNFAMMETRIKKDEMLEQFKRRSEELAAEGKTPLFFGEGDTLLGMIAVADVMKEDSTEAIARLQKMGMKVVMLTGDNERTANAIGKMAGVDEVIADVLPDGKEEVVRNLQKQGKVIMVGDGINDAPALTRADMGIAIGAGTDIAIDAADVVLMKSSLMDVPAAIKLSRGTLRNIHENLFWAFIYNTIGIPLAAGVFISLFGWELNPMFGAAAMSLSSFCVVSNALRLNLLKLF